MHKVILIFFIFCFSICFAQFPETSFRSVNRENTYINYTPPVTPVGATSTSQNTYNAPRKVSRPNDPGDPYASPIGEVPLIGMICLAGLYVYKKNKP